MKKHNEGYVLPFVLVVLVVVCLVAVSLLTASLTNLNRQQASIDQMEAKYEAQGEIEKEIAVFFEDETKILEKTSENVEKSDENQTAFAAAAQKLAYKEVLANFGIAYENAMPDEDENSKALSKTFAYKRDFKSVKKTLQVTAAVTVDITIKVNTPTVAWNAEKNEYTAKIEYTISYSDLVYKDYDISTILDEEVIPNES